ncbi:MAG TPA: AAA family ATPase, partial [Candidatus Limnocylindrales bacterium]
LLERFELSEAARRPAMTYSGGMRRRLDLAMTLAGAPRIIFLDEPTTGLDPRSRRVMWDIIRELVADGVTIFLTTQYLDEADRLASRIVLLDGGRVAAQGAPAELKRLVPGSSIRLEFDGAAGLDRAAQLLPEGSRDDASLVLEVPGDGTVHRLQGLLSTLDEASIELAGLTVRSPDLDDVFLSLTGNGHAEVPAR